jgi:hypothetical protein
MRIPMMLAVLPMLFVCNVATAQVAGMATPMPSIGATSMERSEQLLTRATLLQEVWRYRFVPETNLVDVHMGRLRRKVDAPNEPPMIRNIRGLGFVLDGAPCPLIPPSKPLLTPSGPDK